MWFFDPGRGVYRITSENERYNDEGFIPKTAPQRVITAKDTYWKIIAGFQEGGTPLHYIHYLNEEFASTKYAGKTKAEFPKTVTIQNLAEFVRATGKNSVQLDAKTVLAYDGYSSYYLLVNARKILSWNTDSSGQYLYWMAGTLLSEQEIASLQKYLGTTWALVTKMEIAGLQNEAGEWLPVTHLSSFMMDGTVNAGEKEAKRAFENHLYLLKEIDDYCDQITVERVKKLRNPLQTSISTRCEGCQGCSLRHLRYHVVRGDLDPYLIYSAYDSFTPNGGHAVLLTRGIINNPTEDGIKSLRDSMKKFLLRGMQESSILTFCSTLTPKPDANPWKNYGAQMVVRPDGLKLQLGPNEREEQRDGEWLDEQRRRAERNRVRRIRVEREEVVAPLIGAADIDMGEIVLNPAWDRAVAIEGLEPDPDEPIEDDEVDVF